ncbi:hypothetical protein AWZ03_001843 [Drosophila navojoa]|uniref:Uncharacterized protein n=2 Tax=Drosophila navojoa TaxID=7232 RepID=A0A484BSU1_DRONA|nr:hypothetical protein AWZ03_001843 [Drosophila navojoa]
MAALAQARPYSATTSAPPTPQSHAIHHAMSSVRTAPATPTRTSKRTDDVDGVQDIGLTVAISELLPPAPPPPPAATMSAPYSKPKSQRFFWRKALRRVFQRRK